MTVGGVADKEEYFRIISNIWRNWLTENLMKLKKQEVLSPEPPQAQIGTCWMKNSFTERSRGSTVSCAWIDGAAQIASTLLAALGSILLAGGGKWSFLSTQHLWGRTWSPMLCSILSSQESPVKDYRYGEGTGALVLWGKVGRTRTVLLVLGWERKCSRGISSMYVKLQIRQIEPVSFQ